MNHDGRRRCDAGRRTALPDDAVRRWALAFTLWWILGARDPQELVVAAGQPLAVGAEIRNQRLGHVVPRVPAARTRKPCRPGGGAIPWTACGGRISRVGEPRHYRLTPTRAPPERRYRQRP
jgi:hypothetical protein